MSQEKTENLLETALKGLESDVSLTEEEIAEKKKLKLENAVYKVWGEDDDTQDAEDKDEVSEKEDDGIDGSEEPSEDPSDFKAVSEEEDEDEEDKEEAYMKSDAHEEEEEEEASEAAHEEEDEVEEDEVMEPSEEEDEVMEPSEDEPVKPEMSDEDEESDDVEEDDDDDEMEEDEESDDVEEDEESDDVEEDEESEVEEDEEVEEEEEEEDEVVSSIEQISKTITAAATQKAMDKINATYNSMKEDIDALCAEDESLTEDFKAKAATIFEAAVSAKVRSNIEEIAEDYKVSVEEQVSTLHEDLIEKIDSYMTYVAEQWIKENEVAVTNALRTEIAESFMASLKDTFTDHYIEMPEGKTDMFDEVNQQNTELQDTVAEQKEENLKLRRQLVESHRKAIIKDATEGLVDTQAAKFAELIEDVKFESTSKFKSKVATIKESYFSQKKAVTPAPSKKSNSKTNVKVVTEEIVENKPSVDPIMEKYLNAASSLETSHK